MKYRITIVAVLVALAALAAAAKASASPGTDFLGTITCVTDSGSFVSGELWEDENACDEGFGVLDPATFAVPICVDGTTFLYADDQDGDSPGTAADLVALLTSESYGSVASVGACAKGPAVQPPPGIFLCYSVFQSVPGVWSKEIAAQLLKQGYWMPYAVPGDVAGGTNLGGFHLSCNLAASQSVGDQFVGGDGTVLPAAYSGVPGLYPKVG